MVKITKNFTGGKRLDDWGRDIIEQISGMNEIALEDASAFGADLMTGFIASRPTSWMAEVRGKTGRIETGQMINSVSNKFSKNSKDRWTAAFGWLDVQEDYFLTQEYGGKNSYNGKQIEAMNALSDAAQQAWDALKFELEDNARGA